MSTMHIALRDELFSKLKPFAKNRNKSMSEVVRDSLELLFSLEEIDADKDPVLKVAIERHFTVPKSIPIKSMYIFLFLLSTKLGKQSSKDFWTHAFYRSNLDKTHADIYAEIRDEVDRGVKKAA